MRRRGEVVVETYGPKPLLRHSPGGLSIQEEGLQLIQQAKQPLHVVFTIGGSRCGKSTACNALIFGADSGGQCGFVTGNSFDPVTDGVDVAIRNLPDGGSLVVADCEGAFHICGSEQSARGFGTLGFLAYHLSAVVLHVSMGSIDERDIEVLGHLAASAQGMIEQDQALAKLLPSRHQPKAETEDGPEPVQMSMPSLLLLVNGARFDMGDFVARRLLRPPHGGDRQCARTAIARAFAGQPSLEALPACDHQAYWAKVEGLRIRLLETMVSSAERVTAGDELAERLSLLVAKLNGEAPKVLEPEPQAEAVLRGLHLEPLVEEIAKRFVTGEIKTSSASPKKGMQHASNKAASVASTSTLQSCSSIEDALAEFDERSRALISASTDGKMMPSVRLGVVAEMRERLAERLAGISDAHKRGQQEAAIKQQVTNLEQSPCSDREARTPTPPGTPNGKRRSLRRLQASIEEAELTLERIQSSSTVRLKELRSAVSVAEQHIAKLDEDTLEAEGLFATELRAWQQSLQEQLADASRDRSRKSCAQASKATQVLAPLHEALRSTGTTPTPDGALLEEFRAHLEELQLMKLEAAESAQQTLDERLQELQQVLETEVTPLKELRERVSKHVMGSIVPLREELQVERQERAQRHTALREVVGRLQTSLEATLTMDDSLSTPSRPTLATAPAMPGRWKREQMHAK